MPTTPNVGLPYPVLTDTPDVPRDIKALADRLDGILTAPPSGGGAVALTQLPVLDVGMVNQHRAGHQLAVTDFTARGLSAPAGLWNLSDTSDASGNNRPLTNKASVPFGTGINGLANTAAVFTGATNQALYIADTGANDPFRIRTGSWGCWFRTAKRGANQDLVTKRGVAGQLSYMLSLTSSGNVAQAVVSTDGTGAGVAAGISDVCDDRWHFAVVTYDAALARLYVDGALEAVFSGGTTGLFAGTGPLNIGSYGADAATASSEPHFGRVDEAFVTSDVLTENQIRLLYAAKFAHGYTLPPSTITLNVRRRRRGTTLTAGDFPAQPIRLHNFTAGSLADEGSGNVSLTSNPGTGSIVATAGADGTAANGYSFSGAHTGLSATDTGLPAGTSARSYGCWFQTVVTNGAAIAYGTVGTGHVVAYLNSGLLSVANGADIITGPYVSDGHWHHVIVVEDNAAGDGVRRKLYLDGRLVGGSTVLNAITLAGANRFRIAANADTTGPFTGLIDGAFVHNIALTLEQVLTLYAKGTQALLPSPKNAGDHIEGIDAANLYAVFDTLDSQNQVDLYATA